MDLRPGSTLSHYRIAERIGEGGMGRVYRATDTRLNREVAIKVLPGEVSGDPDRLARFTREAQLLASLNHPNIGAIYGLEEVAGIPFLALELVEGRDLALRLKQGPLEPAEALRVGHGIASALEEAHRKGIIHRDLKPANVKVTPEGKVKVLDFGLAKATAAPRPNTGLSAMATVTGQETRAGTVLGSPAFMSPEQARGLSMDQRTDLWSLGCILFACLSGKLPFTGETVTDILAAVVDREPGWSSLPPGIPPAVRRLLESCLDKSPERRLADAGKARAVLEAALAEASGPRPSRFLSNRAVLALVAVGLAAAATWMLRREEPEAPPAPRRNPPRLAQLTFSPRVEEYPAWSPTGDRLAYTSETGGIRRIVIRDLDSGEERPLSTGAFDEIQPAWMPEGDSLLFVRARAPRTKLQPRDIFGPHSDGDVWLAHLESGRETKIAENAFNPAPSPDGSRIAVDAEWIGGRRIWLLDARGRRPQQLTTEASELVDHYRPSWSRDGRRIAFQHLSRTKFDLRIVDVESRRIHTVTDDPFVDLHPVWSADGGSLFFSSYRSGGLNVWQIPVDPGGGASGSPRQLTTGAGQDVQVALSPDGSRLAFTILTQNSDLWRMPMSPVTGMPEGPPEEVIATTREDSRGAWSPDGTRIAFNSDRAGDMNIWVHDLPSGATRQITRGPGGDYQPRWSPDGRRLVFFSNRAGTSDIWEVTLEPGDLRLLTDSPGNEINPFYSLDGRHIAYHSDRDGRMEVWVMEDGGGHPRRLTSEGVAGGHTLTWSGDGKFIYFRCLCGGEVRNARVSFPGADLVMAPEIKGGSHLSLSPDGSLALDVVGHKVLWLSGRGVEEPRVAFEFEDPGARIDYPTWSPDGEWLLFDRFRPAGGDIWVMSGLEVP